MMIERLRNMFRFNPDERFIAHRYQSSRLALVVGVIMMGVWVEYEWFVNHELRLDLLIILGAMALSKLGAMVYFRITR